MQGRAVWRGAISALVGAVALGIFFRTQLATGFDRVPGDHLDGFIQLSILQHWANWLAGVERWDTTSYFYPWPDTLGYNDGYFLLGLLYALAKVVLPDPFLAGLAAIAAIRAFGFIFFVLFAREALQFGLLAALVGATLVTIASNATMLAALGQLMLVSLIPPFAWLLWRAGRAVVSHRDGAAIGYGLAAAALYGAWLLTAFYTAWFTALLVALTGLAALPFARWRGILRWPVLVITAGFVVSALPFMIVYLPKADETGMHGFAQLLFHSPSLLDYLHIGRFNFVFGWWDDWMTNRFQPDEPNPDEHTIGFAPVLVVAGLVGGLISFRERPRSWLRVALTLATVLALALAAHVGRHTLWTLVYAVVPGAGAVRVLSRIALVITFPLTILAMVSLDRLRRSWLAWPLAALLIAEEFTAHPSGLLDRPAALEFLSAIPPAPASCRSFYVQGSTPSHAIGQWLDSTYPHNTDAMLIAALRQLPTINGISTFNPPDWLMINPTTQAYLRTVRSYLSRHGLTAGVCGLDLGTRGWSEGWPAPGAAAPLSPGVEHHFGDAELDAVLDGGWEGSGPVGRWTTASRATMYFAQPAAPGGQNLDVDFYGLPIVWPNGRTSPIELLANGRKVTTWTPSAGRQHLRASIPAALLNGSQLELALQIDQPRSPSELGTSPDVRRLGFFVLSFRIDPAPG